MPKVSVKLPAVRKHVDSRFVQGCIYYNSVNGVVEHYMSVTINTQGEMRLIDLASGNRWNDVDPNQAYQSVEASPFRALLADTEITLKV